MSAAYDVTTPLEALLRIGEASAILRRSVSSIRNDIKAGRIRCVRLGRQIRIEPAECRRVIARGKQAVKQA